MEEYKAKAQEYLNKFGELPFPKKALIVGVPLFLLATVVTLTLLFSREDYVVLYTALGREDLNAVVSELDRQGVKYRISPDGRTIYVPESVARELRLKLAAKGIPKKGIVGYEIFDKGGVGLSRFQLQVNYKRAIEGELARTIMSLKCVDYARVHIAMPEETLFLREKEEAKASVFLKLLPNCSLTAEQVRAIRNLVAGSIENLSPDNVVIVDDKGRDLTAYLEEEESSSNLTKNQLEIKRKFEKDLEKKIKRILEEALGYGKVSVSVSAELDFSKMKKREELYDPDMTAVVSEHKKKEKTTKVLPQGIPGTEANVPPAEGRNFTEQTLTEKKEKITNYEVSKREIYYEDETVKIKRISVGVLVDQSVNIDPKKLEELIIASAGLDPKRGDKVSVMLTKFSAAAPLEKPPKKVPLYIYILLGLASLVFLSLITFGIIRLIKKRKEEEVAPVPTYPTPPPIEEVKKSPYEEFIELAQKEPKKAAIILKSWLKEG